MNDKELLELAAKAVSYRISNRLTDGGLMVMNDNRPAPHKWNPLTDDGDALRLAVKLDIDINPLWGDECCTQAVGGDFFYEERGSDPYAATRRAIVRAAAAIGAKL